MVTSNSEIEKSPREIAEAFVEKWNNYASGTDAIEALIRERDERAARIAETIFEPAHTYSSENAEVYRAYDRGQQYAMKRIASAIRGKSK
jgi:hypothetical protein